MIIGLFRLLVFLGILYLAYRAVRAVLPGPGRYDRQQGREIDDTMVKDPECEVYIPVRQGIPAKVDGETQYFCSEKCRDAYLAKHK
ncbi:MAG: hypothetical protein ACLFOY_10290 [Desulfatibacillaceae bacterium]